MFQFLQSYLQILETFSNMLSTYRLMQEEIQEPSIIKSKNQVTSLRSPNLLAQQCNQEGTCMCQQILKKKIVLRLLLVEYDFFSTVTICDSAQVLSEVGGNSHVCMGNISLLLGTVLQSRGEGSSSCLLLVLWFVTSCFHIGE